MCWPTSRRWSSRWSSAAIPRRSHSPAPPPPPPPGGGAPGAPRQYGVSAVLVLPADLPLLAGEDVQSLIAHAQNPPVVAIAPDRHQQGTNALLITPPGLIEYEFGPEASP